MNKNYPLLITIYTGICILVDKYVAKFYAKDVYIKPEFELLWILILYLVLFATSEKNEWKKNWTVIFVMVLSIVTAISVYKIIYFQV